MTLLCQIVAIEPTLKSSTYATLTRLHRDSQRTQANGPFTGITRAYTPIEDGGEQLPGESTKVQMSIAGLVDEAGAVDTKLWDLVATKETTNCTATGTVTVDGQDLIKDAPVTFLLFLEKQLRDLHTFVAKLPTLDPADTWHFDSARNCWATDSVRSARTKKIPQNHVLAPATDKHPAQVSMYTTDETVGYWETTKLSGCLPAERVATLLERVEKLQRAVAFAREQANTAQVTDRKVGAAVFDYLLAQ